MTDMGYCKTHGVVEIEGKLDATGIVNVCMVCGEETVEIEAAMVRAANMLLRHTKPWSNARFV